MNSMFDLFLKGGPVGILTLLISIVAFVLSIFSIINSCNQKEPKLPISLKLLFMCPLATLFTGAFGSVTGYIAVFSGLASATGSDKVAVMEHGLQTARITLQIGLASALFQLFVVMISLFILNNNSIRLNIPELSLLNQIKKIPILLYPAIFLLIPVVFGIASSFWNIEYIIKTKPGNPIPALMKMNLDYLLVTLMFCSVLGAFLVFMFFIQMIIKKDKTIKGEYNE